jgi:DNA-binding NtrC family response regulator
LHARVARYRRLLGAKYQLGRLVGESLAMKRVRSQVALAATGKASVVVIGPAGSGRQQVARTIHYAQAEAASGPLVPLACPLLGAELMQSTIRALARPKQGERGPLAPQGVDADRLASLLLIDADRLAADAQAELAGFLTLADLPVRIISTTRRPLLELAGQKTFRPDLASLLSTLVIEIPPLAERLDDLPLLAQWFLEQANSRGPKQVGGFTPEALDRLHGYAWPGGVSELESLVNEAHARAEGHEIMPRDLPPRIDLAAEASARPLKLDEVIVLEEFLGRIERELIERALKRAKGNKTKAARLLGMTRPRLYRRLVQLGLDS